MANEPFYWSIYNNRSLTRHIKVSWASCQIRKIALCECTGNAGKVLPPPRVSHPGMHRGTCVTAITAVQHVPWCMPGSLTNGFLWSRWRGKRSRHSRCMRNPQFNVSGQNPCCISTHRRHFENLIKANVVYTQTNSGCLFIYRVKQT